MRISIQSAHLRRPRAFARDHEFQTRLDRFFRQNERKSALEQLKKLNTKFKTITGAPPYVTSRRMAKDRSEMYVVRHSDSGRTKTTSIPVAEMPLEQAKKDPRTQAALAKLCEDILFELKVEHAPTTVRYSEILRRYIASEDPSTGDPLLDLLRAQLNKERNIHDPSRTFKQKAYCAEILIKEFFEERTLFDHHFKLPTEIKDWLVEKFEKTGATYDVRGQPAGALDGTVAKYVSVVRQSLTWVDETLQPPINLKMESLKVERGRTQPLMWTTARLIVLFARGFVWDLENGGFVKEWVWRGDDWVLEWKREGAAHRAKFLPLIRHVLSYETVGTRLTCASHMGWEEDSYRGWIDFENRQIVRTGTNSPRYDNKPRETSPLLPLALRMFETFHANDRRLAARDGWSHVKKPYVIHNGRGGPVRKLADLMGKANIALGLDDTSRSMRAANITQLWLAGFDLRRSARLAGNDPQTAEQSYLYLEKEFDGVTRPRPDPDTMLFSDLVNPVGRLPPIPRAPVPPRPTARPATAAVG
jgi:hypothetical protein